MCMFCKETLRRQLLVVMRSNFNRPLILLVKNSRNLLRQKGMWENDYISCYYVRDCFSFVSLSEITNKKLGQPANALSILIRCVDLAEKYNARLVYLGSVTFLAKALNAFGQCRVAYWILNSVMPYVLDHHIVTHEYRSLKRTIDIWKRFHTCILQRV